MLHFTACKLLAPQPGAELVPFAAEARSPKHWSAEEVPPLRLLNTQMPILPPEQLKQKV